MKQDLLMRHARISEFPKSWKLKTVGQACKIRNDLRKPISVEERDKIRGSYPYYGPTGVLGFINEYLVDGRYALIGEDGDHFLKYSEKEQTILVDGKFNDNNHAHLIEATNDCSVEWFYHFFKHRNIIPYLSRQGAGRYKLNKETLQKLPVLLPSIKEQKNISDLLSTWDTAIDKIERLIAAKENRAKYLSVRRLFGNGGAKSSQTKETRWFKVPMHWQITKIGKIAREVRVKNGSNHYIPVLSCTKYDGLVDSLSYFGKQIFSTDTSKYKIVKNGQFAYATNHIEEGSIGYQDKYPEGLVSPMYTVFETNQSIDDSYLYKVLKTDIYRHIFQSHTSASVDRRGSLRWNEFAKLPIPLPPIEEQRQIANMLDAASHEIDLLKKQLDAYRRQKRGLMQKLLTGKWRVKMEEK